MKKVLTVLWIIISVISISAVRESSEVKEIINNKVIEDFGKAGLFDEVRNATFSEKEKRILKNYYYEILLKSLKDSTLTLSQVGIQTDLIYHIFTQEFVKYYLQNFSKIYPHSELLQLANISMTMAKNS